MTPSIPRHHYLVQPKQQRAAATVLIFPTWSGLTDFEKEFADTLADWGFRALAIDLYGNKHNPQSIEEKSEKMALLTRDYPELYTQLTQLIDDAVASADDEHQTDQPLYSLGFCLGGKLSLMAGLTHPRVSKAVSLHGLLDIPLPQQRLNTPCQFLICNGRQDPMVSSEQKETFLASMDQESLDWQLLEFSNTMHSFMLPEANNPDNGVLYNARSAQRAMGYVTNFLNTTIQPERS